MKEAAYSRTFVFALIAVCAALSWVPGWLSHGDQFWLGLSSNLFASFVAVGFTVFGVDVLLRAIGRRSPRNKAVREAVRDNVSWILNRLYTIDGVPFDAELPGLAALEDTHRIPATIADLWPSHGPNLAVALGGRPLASLVLMVDEAAARLDALRHAASLGDAALPDTAVPALLKGITVLEAAVDLAGGARLRLNEHGEDAAVTKRAYARVVGGVLAGSLEQLCIALFAVERMT